MANRRAETERLRAQYLLRTRLRVYRHRVVAARALVEDARQIGRCSVSFSGGKDSLALLHLAQSIDSTIPGCFFDSGAELPDTLATIAEMERRGHRILRIKPQYSIVEMAEQVGLWGYQGPNKLPGQWHWKKSDWIEDLIEEPARRVRELGYPVTLLGLRKEENRGRRIGLQKYGLIHQRKDGAWIASPLANWETADVFAYCFEWNLPLSAVYLQPDDAERERRRTGTALGEKAVWMGRRQWLRRHDPAFWADLVALFPDLARES